MNSIVLHAHAKCDDLCCTQSGYVAFVQILPSLWGLQSLKLIHCSSTLLSSSGILSKMPQYLFMQVSFNKDLNMTFKAAFINIVICFQVNCISTEFTPRKHGGEKGVPFRIQVDTFIQNEPGEYLEHVHSSSCQIKVFKVKERFLCCVLLKRSLCYVTSDSYYQMNRVSSCSMP